MIRILSMVGLFLLAFAVWASAVDININANLTTNNITLTSDTKYIVKTGKTYTVNGTISDAGNDYALTKSGLGAMLLRGTNTYGGGTTIAEGTLALSGSGSISSSSGLVLTAGAGFDISGISASSTTVQALITGSGSTINLGSLSSLKTLNVTNNASFTNTTMNIDAAGATSGTYTLVDYDTVSNTDVTVAVANLVADSRGGSYFDASATALMYELIIGNTTLTWNGASSLWNTDAANTNWNTGNGNATYFKSGDAVLFGDAANKTVTVDPSGVSVASMTVTAAGYTFHLTADAATPNAATISATGAVDLGGSTIVVDVKNAGTLKRGQGNATRVTVVDAGSVAFNGTTTLASGLSRVRLAPILGSGSLAYDLWLASMREESDRLFNSPGLNNDNLKSGGDFLDWLSDQNPATLDDILDAFDAAHGLGGQAAALSLQQLYGGYSAYANSALAVDGDRFRRRWQTWNRHFFDLRLFEDQLAGVASASGYASPVYGPRDTISCGTSRVWAGGFGTWARQDGKSNLPGYKYDSQGAAIGYEYSIGSFNFGLAVGYSNGDLKVNDLRYKNDADIMNLALYGAYIHESGFYAEGGFGYGHAWNDYRVNSIATPGGVKTGKYGSDSFTADLELGYVARLPRDFNLIPSVGVEYTYLWNGSWTENVMNAALVANRFDAGHDNGVDIPLGVRFNKRFRFGCSGGFVIIPEVRASYVYAADKSHPSITAGFVNTPGGVEMVGVEPGRSHWRIGAGLSGRVSSRVDFRVDYDFDTRSGYKGHNLNASLGLSF